MARQNLLVIGNGMAGARAVEEILARGGAALLCAEHVQQLKGESPCPT